MIHLLIADDHPVVREGLKYVVSQSRDIEVVGEAEDGDGIVSLCQRVEADVLLLDVSMPGPGVLELIRNLRTIRPKLRILVLSVHPEKHYARRVLKAGADGYLTKNQSSTALGAAIRQVHSGRKYVSPSLAEELALDLSIGRTNTPHDGLSNREYEVLLQLGAGRRVDEVARRLRLSPKTVRTYRSRILEKMSFRSTAELIFYAVSRGLVTEMAAAPELEAWPSAESPGTGSSRAGAGPAGSRARSVTPRVRKQTAAEKSR